MSSRRFAELRFPEVADRVSADSVLVLPIGAVEQHGPHLPLVTDLLIAEATADAVLDAFGDELDLWLLPPLAYSKSNEHAWAPGSVWLDPSTLLAVLDDVGRSLQSLAASQAGVPQRPRRQLVVAQRGLPGAAPPPRAARRSSCHPSVPPDQGGESTVDELGMGIHAGLHETSVVLHLRPDLVDMTLARRNVPEWLAANRHVRFGGAVSLRVVGQRLRARRSHRRPDRRDRRAGQGAVRGLRSTVSGSSWARSRRSASADAARPGLAISARGAAGARTSARRRACERSADRPGTTSRSAGAEAIASRSVCAPGWPGGRPDRPGRRPISGSPSARRAAFETWW